MFLKTTDLPGYVKINAALPGVFAKLFYTEVFKKHRKHY